MYISKLLAHPVSGVSFHKTQKRDNQHSGFISESSSNGLNPGSHEILGRSLIKNKKLKPIETCLPIPKEELTKYLEKVIEQDKNSETPIIKSVHPEFISQFTDRVCNNPNRSILIGLSGESASGKTTICDLIQNTAEKLDVPIEVISADNYFKDISALISKYGSFDGVIESGYDVDSPDNFDMQQLHDDLEQLSTGNDVRIPQYLVNGTGISVPNAIPKKSQKIIVVEGLATLYKPVRDLLDAEIFVDINPILQEERYIERAKASRNQTEEDAKVQLKYVREAAQKYLYPKKDSSDILIDGGVSQERYSELITNMLCMAKNLRRENRNT